MILLHLAIQQPELIRAMSLWGTSNCFGSDARSMMEQWSLPLTKYILPHWRKIHIRGDEQLEALVEQYKNQRNVYDDMNWISDELSLIKTPTQIIHGDRDEFFPIDIAVAMYQAIPESSLWVLPNTGHNIFAGLNRYEESNGNSAPRFPLIVQKFLKECGAE